MNIQSLTDSLMFIAETQELRNLNLTEEEIQGYFEFNWSLGRDLIAIMIKRGTNDQH